MNTSGYVVMLYSSLAASDWLQCLMRPVFCVGVPVIRWGFLIPGPKGGMGPYKAAILEAGRRIRVGGAVELLKVTSIYGEKRDDFCFICSLLLYSSDMHYLNDINTIFWGVASSIVNLLISNLF